MLASRLLSYRNSPIIMSLRRSSRKSVTAVTQVPPDAPKTKVSIKHKVQPKKKNPSKFKSEPTKVQPSTPTKRRKLNDGAAAKAAPITPTPAAVSAMTVPYSTGDIDDLDPPPREPRPTEPHMTNAILRTPRGSKLVAVPKAHNAYPTTGLSMASDTTTTETLLDTACAHLIKVDPKLRPVIEQNPCRIFSPEGLAEEVDPFRSLASGIFGQQVSGAAATAIKNKFVGLFNEGKESPHAFPTPAQVAATPLERLRLAGLSGRKTEYVQGLAEKFANGELSAKMLVEASDEEVLERLTAVRGLGRWSVEMFLCFALKRLDILSTGDLGVQRGMAAYDGRDVAKLKAKGGGKFKYMSEQDMLSISEKFAPYRSLFMWLMWRIENVDVSAMQGTP